MSDRLQELLEAERARCAHITARGVGMPMAGGVYWLTVAWAYSAFAPRTAAVVAFMATGAVFPIGFLLTKWLGGDLFAKSPLSGLGMIFNAMQLLAWPVLIVMLDLDARLVPMTMAVLFGAHFIGYGWLYSSRGYWVLGLGLPIVTMVVQMLAKGQGMIAVPIAAAIVHAVAVVLILHENRRPVAAMPVGAIV